MRAGETCSTVADLARGHTGAALAVLVGVMSDTSADLSARVKAARTLLEPRQGTEHHPGFRTAREAAARFLRALSGAEGA